MTEKIDISGVILTKMDGDSKGGAALSIKVVIGKPIIFIGIGEKIDQLEIGFVASKQLASKQEDMDINKII